MDKPDVKTNKTTNPASPKLDAVVPTFGVKQETETGMARSDGHKPTSETEPRNRRISDSTHKPAPTTTHAERKTTSKTANGIVHGKAHNYHVKSDVIGNEDSELEKKAHALLSKAVMRRMAKIGTKNASSVRKTSSPQPSPDLDSSAGSRSLNEKSSPVTSKTRSAQKTNSMQSLAVPGPGTVPTPTAMDADDRASLESRKDSLKQSMDSSSRKSVDYKLQTSQAVVTAGGGGEEKPKHVLMPEDSLMRAAIPALPVPLAVICLILNILVPGSGTILSGLSMLCCGKSRLSNKGDAVATTVCVNLCVGAAQLGTVTFLLVGWFWSLAWGVKMMILAVEHREEQKQLREKELQALALRAFGSPGTMGRPPLP